MGSFLETLDISAENLKIQFGNELVLDHVNLQVEKGERLVIVGPSGHGSLYKYRLTVTTWSGLL